MSNRLLAFDARDAGSVEAGRPINQYSEEYTEAREELADEHPAVQWLSQIHRDMGQSLRRATAAHEKHSSQSDRVVDPLTTWGWTARKTFAIVAVFSLFVNVLMLAMPIYLFQISDRVLTSRSLDTLLMLSGLALGLLATMSMFGILRRQILGRLAASMEIILGGPILARIVSAPTDEGGNVQALRSLHQVRSFLSSPTMLLLFDAPLSPFYFGVIFLIHPDLGAIVLIAGLVLFGIAVLNRTATAGPHGKAGTSASKADAHAESLARNARVVNAMGMLNESILHWSREQAEALALRINANDKNFWISGASKFARLVTQIAILGWGAHLALNGALTGGMMIAASIIAGRALQPLEGMIEGWRSLVQTRGAYARVRATLEAAPPAPEHDLEGEEPYFSVAQESISDGAPCGAAPLGIRSGDFSCVEIRQRAQTDADVRSRQHST